MTYLEKLIIIALFVSLFACGRAQLDTITNLACPVSAETQASLVSTYGPSGANTIINKFCP